MITCFHSILLCHTKPLHVLDHYIQQTLLRSCSFPPAWKLHLQHSLSNISTLSLFHVFASSAVPVIPYSRSHYHIANTSFHSSCDHSVISTQSILPAFSSSLSVALDDWHQTLKLILFPSLLLAVSLNVSHSHKCILLYLYRLSFFFSPSYIHKQTMLCEMALKLIFKKSSKCIVTYEHQFH